MQEHLEWQPVPETHAAPSSLRLHVPSSDPSWSNRQMPEHQSVPPNGVRGTYIGTCPRNHIHSAGRTIRFDLFALSG